MTFKAIRIAELKKPPEFVALEESDLAPGDVVVAVEYSAVNYKDGLALTHRAPILRRFPLIPGIDFAGTVISSASPDFASGDRVTGNGFGLGVSHDGGFSQRARVPAEWLVRLPQAISTRAAAGIGTAGITAMLAVLALEHNGVSPGGEREILVTGAGGGVGSLAVALLSRLGYRVAASTGRAQLAGYLKELGAAEIIGRKELSEPPQKPLARARWAGAIDSVGNHTLENVLAQAQPEAAIASVGLAQGADLTTTVYPFILRGVVLAGINSVDVPRSRRVQVWSRLAKDLDPRKLEKIAPAESMVGLASVPTAGVKIIRGETRGRVVVDVNA